MTNILLLVQDHFATGKMQYTDVDEAILVANTLVEINHSAPASSPEFEKIEALRTELLQDSIDYIRLNHNRGVMHERIHTDQLILIFNTIVSGHTMNGKIDLTGSSHIYVPPVSDGEQSDSGEDEQTDIQVPDIFNPSKLLDSLSRKNPQQYAKVNKQPILNLIARSMRRGDKDVKQKVIQIFKTNLLLGQNFHYEVSNRHIDMALSEILSYFNTEKNNLHHDF